MSEPLARGDAAPVVVARGLSKEYIGGDGRPIHVLEGVDLEVAAGESIAVIGQSGAGKSTLLHLLGGLDAPRTGDVRVAGSDLSRLAPEPLARLRNDKVGFVFQFHHLLREFSALENVMMPLLIGGADPRGAAERARQILVRVGLEPRLEHKPAQLSGGEQQRVAVARALVTGPVLLLADEPSGNLDPPTGERLHDLLFEVSRENGAAMILVTHNLDLAARADRVLRLLGGKLVPAGEEREELPTGSWGD
jgi:lipoprotein-releasing system ATP-binding protein